MTDHLAIMRKSWGLTNKILSGEKSVESRWYNTPYPPWSCIKAGDVVYFKDSGEAVSIKASVQRVLQFSDLTPVKVKEILSEYGARDGIKDQLPEFFTLFRDKKYCILIFLKNPKKIKSFQISKKGFGMMASWICVKDIAKLKV